MTVPVDGRRGDWPRLAANAINGLLRRTKTAVAYLGTVAVAETLGSSFAGGMRQVSVSWSGIDAGDALLILPAAALAADYGIVGAVGDGSGTLQVTLITPALSSGDSYSIPCRIYRLA